MGYGRKDMMAETESGIKVKSIVQIKAINI